MKSIFVNARRVFDKDIQKSKKSHWGSYQADLLSACINNLPDFWKFIGRIGISQYRNRPIPLEVVDDDGSVSSDFNIVLNKLKCVFLVCMQKEIPLPNQNIHKSENANNRTRLNTLKMALWFFVRGKQSDWLTYTGQKL